MVLAPLLTMDCLLLDRLHVAMCFLAEDGQSVHLLLSLLAQVVIAQAVHRSWSGYIYNQKIYQEYINLPYLVFMGVGEVSQCWPTPRKHSCKAWLMPSCMDHS